MDFVFCHFAISSSLSSELELLLHKDPGYNCGGHHGLVVGVFDCGPSGQRLESALSRSTLTFPQWSVTG